MNKYNALNAEYDQLYPQPMKHASTHAKNGSDPITPSSIGAAELGADGKVLTSQLPSIEVDAYTKVQTLSDTTKTLFGLDANAVPDDALALLSRFHKGLGNEYVWAKSDSTGVVGYVNSPSQNAYPPAVSDGYTYTALGQLGAKVQIETGSYTGTGTYGGDNPNHLTFNEEPFLVFLYAYHWSDNWGQISRDGVNSRIMMIPQFLPVGLPKKNNVLGFSQDGGSGRGWKSDDGKTIYWYSSTNANNQYNYSGYVYYYMAIYK